MMHVGVSPSIVISDQEPHVHRGIGRRLIPGVRAGLSSLPRTVVPGPRVQILGIDLYQRDRADCDRPHLCVPVRGNSGRQRVEGRDGRRRRLVSPEHTTAIKRGSVIPAQGRAHSGRQGWVGIAHGYARSGAGGASGALIHRPALSHATRDDIEHSSSFPTRCP